MLKFFSNIQTLEKPESIRQAFFIVQAFFSFQRSTGEGKVKALNYLSTLN